MACKGSVLYSTVCAYIIILTRSYHTEKKGNRNYHLWPSGKATHAAQPQLACHYNKRRYFCLSVHRSAVEMFGTQTEEVQPGPQHGTPKMVAKRPQPTNDYGNKKLSLSPLWNVKQWAAIVRRILSYPNTNENTPISTYWANNKHDHITGEMMTNALQAGVEATRCDRLGISTIEIGTHSIRSGAAMAMYLNNVQIILIMKIGRWKSTAFLDYIQSQVEEFTVDVSQLILGQRSS